MKLHCPGVAVVALLIIVVLTGQGCKGSDAPGGVKITNADRQEAHQIFTTRCAACHGQFGRGDGPGAAGLNPKPRNYADAAWQSATTDEEIEKAIVYGGAAVGKSLQMVANPDLQAKPGVVAALREIVRSFGKD
jgi:mono/diheme cytochrome c family protein